MTDTKKPFCPSHPNPLCQMKEGKGLCGGCGYDFSQQVVDRESRAQRWEEARLQGENQKADAAEEVGKEERDKARWDGLVLDAPPEEQIKRLEALSAAWETKMYRQKAKAQIALLKKQVEPPPSVPPDPPLAPDPIVSPPDPIVPPSQPEKKSKTPAKLVFAGVAAIVFAGIASYGIWQDKQSSRAEVTHLQQQVADAKAQVALLAKPASAPPAPAAATGPMVIPTAAPGSANYRAGQVIAPDCAGCPEMVAIPAGAFEMGSNDSDSFVDKKFIHHVTISKPFALGKTEVTQGQWKAVMGSLPPELYFKACGDDCPVERVSWNVVQDFIKKLNARTGKTYRLPSEAEWEYACRAGGQHKYCGSDDVGAVAWYNENSDSGPHPVAGKRPNAWGLYDMSGNVLEWVEDCYHDSYKEAPKDGSAWTGCGSYAGRMLRGGSWSNYAGGTRAASRYSNSPGFLAGDGGFRLARMLP